MNTTKDYIKMLFDYVRSEEYKKDINGERDFYSSLDDATLKERLYDSITECDYDNSKIGKYEFKYLFGYTGSEGGGCDIHFAVELFDNLTQSNIAYFYVSGYYDSYNGSEISKGDIVVAKTLTRREVTKTLVTLLDESGNELISELVDV